MKQENKLKKKIKLARVEANLTQTELAKKVKSSQQSIVSWEKGSFVPSLENIKKIAKATGKPVNYFFENSGNIADNNSTISVNQNTDYRILALEKELALLKKDLEIFKLVIEKKLAEEKKK